MTSRCSWSASARTWPPDVAKVLKRLGVLKLLPEAHHHVSRLDALKQAAAMVRR